MRDEERQRGNRVLLELFAKTSMGEIVLGNDHQTCNTTQLAFMRYGMA